ncbi:MAG: tetratricopeptide repeat protein [Pseudobdellovibrionaceae bacterium]
MKDVKRPSIGEKITLILQQAVQWLAGNFKVLFVGFIGLLILGGGYSIWSGLKEKSEQQEQEAFYPLEKQFFDKKNNFEQALRQKQQAEAGLKSPAGKKNKDQLPAIAAPKLESLPSGDLQKDFGDLVQSFEALISKNKNSKSAQMSALILSGLFLDYKNPEKALEVLNQVLPTAKDFIHGLLLLQKGNALAEQNQCDTAIKTWDAIVNDKKLNFLQAEAQYRQAFCYQNLNDLASAEKIYHLLADSGQNKNSLISAEADKFLRLIKAQKTLIQ